MFVFFALISLLLAVPTGGGLLTALGTYATCQTGCNTVWVACYAAAGAVAGTVTAGAATPAVILGCNGALGTCMAACWAATAGAGISPTP